MKNRPVIKKEGSGFASHEGNGMVGGRWSGCERLAYKSVYISDHIDQKHSIIEKASEWLNKHNLDSITVECYIEFDDDDSTNHHSVTIDELFYPDEFDERINKCPYLTKKQKAKTIENFKRYLDELEYSDFQLYDLYEPEYED